MLSKSIGILVLLAGFSLFFSIKMLKQHERGIVLTLGRFTGVKGPGLVLLIPFVQLMIRVDLNTVQDFDAMVSKFREPTRDMRKIVDKHMDA